MFNRGAIIAALAAASIDFSSSAPPALGGQFEMAVEPASTRAKRKKLLASDGALPRKYRNRWKAAKPKRRANRLHMSRRVRRRHRRARRAA